MFMFCFLTRAIFKRDFAIRAGSRIRKMISMQKIPSLLFICFSLVIADRAFADDPPKTPEDLARDASVAAFTKKMQEANYPALFAKAAKEFNVPVEILQGLSFAETRWEHFIWPEGETVSPENGMPRPYGIMSLWDNEYFGHSLLNAAKLIGKTPADLMKDPLDNMRGAAALLRKLYDENKKPEGTTESELESWRYAMAEYSGIPEPDLKQQHAFDVYHHLSEGYDEYGIKFDEVSGLKLDEMYAEVKKIKDEEKKKREAKFTDEDRDAAGLGPVIRTDESAQTASSSASVSGDKSSRLVAAAMPNKEVAVPVAAAAPTSTAWGLAAVLALAAVVLAFLLFRKKTPLPKKPN